MLLAQYLRGRDGDGSANTGGARNPPDQWEAGTPEPGRIKYLYTPQNTEEGEERGNAALFVSVKLRLFTGSQWNQLEIIEEFPVSLTVK